MYSNFTLTFLSCGGIFLLAFVAIGAFWFAERLRGANAPRLGKSG
jgi:hypothetical protein